MDQLTLYEDRKYVLFSTDEVDNIDFTIVEETSAETLRRSNDGKTTFVKWEGEVPQCIQNLTTKSDYLTHSEIMQILLTSDWISPDRIAAGNT